MKKLLFSMLLLLGVSMISVAGDRMPIRIGEHRLCVPKGNIPRELGFLDWIYKIPGLDKEVQGLMYDFSSEELAAAIPNYRTRDSRGVDQSLIGLMQYLSDKDRESARKHTGISDMWSKQGGYTDRFVEQDEQTGLYKIFTTPEPESRQTWGLFSRYPDETRSVPDLYSFEVAGCQYGVEINDHEAPVMCTLRFLGDEHIHTTASISGGNIHLYDEIREFVRSQIAEWKAACSD